MDEFELPTEIKAPELEEFAALHLEAVSPFPIHQLAWGFLSDRELGKMLVYATLRDKIIGSIQRAEENSEADQHLLPVGVATAGLSGQKREVLAIKSPQGVWLLDFHADQMLPQVLDHISLEDSEATPLDDSRIDDLEKSCPADFPVENIRFFHTDWCLKWKKGRGSFLFTEIQDGPASDVIISGREFSRRELWWADLRSSDFKSSLRKQSKRENIIAGACLGAVAIFVLSAALELMNLTYDVTNARWDQKVDSARSLVSELEDKHRLREQLYSLLADEPGTFAFLSYINGLRDPAVHYNRVETRGNQVVIDCETNSVEQVNRFVSRLRAGEGINSVEMSNQTTRVTGSVTFTLTLQGTVPRLNRQPESPEESSSVLAMGESPND